MRHAAPSALVLPLLLAAPAGAQWSTDQLSAPRYHLAAAAVEGRVLFAGGGDGTGFLDVVDILDTATGQWSTAQLSVARAWIGATSVGSTALFAGGGLLGTPMEQDTVDLYDGATGQWSTATLSQARVGPAAASVGGVALFAGGELTVPPYQSDRVDLYHAASGTWSTAALSKPGERLCAAASATHAYFVNYDRLEIYTAATQAWSWVPMPLPLNLRAAVFVGGKLVVAGGVDKQGSPSARVDLYDPVSGTWSTATLSAARYGLTSAAIGSRALIVGGTDGPARAEVDLYDAASDTWDTALLSQARFYLAATTWGRRAYFGGGFAVPGPGYSDVVDVYEEPAFRPYCLCAAGPCGNDDPAAGCANSTGQGAVLGPLAGATSVAADDLVLLADGMPGGEPVLLVMGSGSANVPLADGTLCIASGFAGAYRFPLKVTTAAGNVRFGPGLVQKSKTFGKGRIDPGETWHFQVWYRDLAGPCGAGANLTHALAVTFEP